MDVNDADRSPEPRNEVTTGASSPLKEFLLHRGGVCGVQGQIYLFRIIRMCGMAHKTPSPGDFASGTPKAQVNQPTAAKACVPARTRTRAGARAHPHVTSAGVLPVALGGKTPKQLGLVPRVRSEEPETRQKRAGNALKTSVRARGRDITSTGPHAAELAFYFLGCRTKAGRPAEQPSV